MRARQNGRNTLFATCGVCDASLTLKKITPSEHGMKSLRLAEHQHWRGVRGIFPAFREPAQRGSSNVNVEERAGHLPNMRGAVLTCLPTERRYLGTGGNDWTHAFPC